MKYSLYLILVSSFTTVFGQVGINNPNPDSTAILDLKSIKQGLLIPRMTLFERRNIGTPAKPANGLVVYDKDEAMLYYYDTLYIPTGTDGQAWTGLSPFLFRDDNFTVLGQTHIRDAYTHSSIKNIGIATQTPLSKLTVNGNVSIGDPTVTAEANGLSVKGNVNFSTNLTVVNTVKADSVIAKTFSGNGIVPVGSIIMWTGTTVPDNSWVLCNGSLIVDTKSPYNGQNSPDLSGRFIIGYNTTYPIKTPGGATTHNHTVNSHNHSIPALSFSGTTGGAQGETKNRCWCADGEVSAPGHQHAFSGNTVANTSGNSSPGTNTINHLPPYYALAYIMRIK